jgi:sugar lactone lactonase YvrE
MDLNVPPQHRRAAAERAEPLADVGRLTSRGFVLFSYLFMIMMRCPPPGSSAVDFGRSDMQTLSRRLVPLALAAATVLAFPLSASAAPDSIASGRPPTGAITVTGFDRPESALYDAERDVYLVSNITNGPRDLDNSGFISRVSPNGRVLDLRWIAGGVNGVTLNAPKGSAVVDDVLYVADIDHLRRFDARTGRPLGSIFFPTATFLNDVAGDRDGNVYVTDIGFTTVPAFGPSGTDAIYRVSQRGRVSVVAAGNSLLHHPNGIAVLPNGLLQVVTYDPFEGTKEAFTIDRQGRKANVVTLPTGLLDGVVVLRHSLLVSSWVDFSNATAGVIYCVAPEGTATQVAGGFQNAADIGYDSRRDRVLIPELPDPGTGGRLVIRPLPCR